MTLPLHKISWAVLAVIAGLVIAMQPTALSIAGIALVALVLSIVITPYAALTLMLVIAPLRTLIATEAPIQLPLDIGQISLIVFIGVWAGESLVNRRRLPRIRWTAVYLPVIGFFAAASLSAFTALSMSAWLNEWLKWAQILVLIALIFDLGKRNQGREWIVFALTLAGVANALIGIYEFFGGSGALHLLVNGDNFRAFGTFGQPNPFGGFMGLIAPIAVTAALASWRRWWNNQHHPSGWAVGQLVQALFFTFGSAITLTALYFSWSRGAWLGAGASIVIVVLAIPRKISISLAIIGFGIGLMLLATASGRIPQSIVSRLNSITGELASAGDVRGIDINAANYANLERLAHWQAALSMGAAYPWTGVGFGNYEDAYFEFSLLNWDIALGHAHNYYLNIFAETGIIGFTAYTSMMLFIFALTWRLRQHPDPSMRLIGIGVLGSWSYLMVHSLTDNLYVNNLFLHIGALFALVALLRDRLLRVTHG